MSLNTDAYRSLGKSFGRGVDLANDLPLRESRTIRTGDESLDLVDPHTQNMWVNRRPAEKT